MYLWPSPLPNAVELVQSNFLSTSPVSSIKTIFQYLRSLEKKKNILLKKKREKEGKKKAGKKKKNEKKKETTYIKQLIRRSEYDTVDRQNYIIALRECFIWQIAAVNF